MGGITHPASYFGKSPHAERQFKMQHHLRHATYDKSASRSGVSLPGLDLTGQITQDWLMRHSFRHKTFRVLIGASGVSPTVDLESLDWSNRRAVQAWMQYHANLHDDLDQYFGLKS